MDFFLIIDSSRYQKIEKASLALVTASRKLQWYFLTHSIVVQIDLPPEIGVLPTRYGQTFDEVSHRVIQVRGVLWSKESLEISVFTNFLVKITPIPLELNLVLVIFIDRSSNNKGSGAGVILKIGYAILQNRSFVTHILRRSSC